MKWSSGGLSFLEMEESREKREEEKIENRGAESRVKNLSGQRRRRTLFAYDPGKLRLRPTLFFFRMRTGHRGNLSLNPLLYLSYLLIKFGLSKEAINRYQRTLFLRIGSLSRGHPDPIPIRSPDPNKPRYSICF